MFDLPSFMAGMLAGMLIFGVFGWMAAGALYRKTRRNNPYAPRRPDDE